MNHPCLNKCTDFNGEPCGKCLIEQIEAREYELGLAPDDAYVKGATTSSTTKNDAVSDSLAKEPSL